MDKHQASSYCIAMIILFYCSFTLHAVDNEVSQHEQSDGCWISLLHLLGYHDKHQNLPVPVLEKIDNPTTPSPDDFRYVKLRVRKRENYAIKPHQESDGFWIRFLNYSYNYDLLTEKKLY